MSLENIDLSRQSVQNRKQLEAVLRSRETPRANPTEDGLDDVIFLLSELGPHPVACDRYGAFSIFSGGQDPITGATVGLYTINQDFSQAPSVWKLYDAKNKTSVGHFDVTNTDHLSGLKNIVALIRSDSS